MSRILVSGSLAYDRIMTFPGYFKDQFLPDQLDKLNVSFTVEGFSEGFGGTAGNIVYNLALLGEKPELIATAGNDFEKYRQWLQKLGVETKSIVVDSKLPTAGAYVMTDKRESQIAMFNPGAAVNAWKGKIPEAELAIVSPGNVVDMVMLAKEYQKRGTPYFFDAGQQISALRGEDLREAIPGAAVVFGNEYEMELMLQKLGWSMEGLLEKVPVVVTTRGGNGSQITTREKVYEIKPVSTQGAVDPTGAGDAYRAGFAKGFLKKLSLQTVGQLASTVAVYAVEKHGTQNHTFTLSELQKRYKETYGEALKI